MIHLAPLTLTSQGIPITPVIPTIPTPDQPGRLGHLRNLGHVGQLGPSAPRPFGPSAPRPARPARPARRASSTWPATEFHDQFANHRSALNRIADPMSCIRGHAPTRGARRRVDPRLVSRASWRTSSTRIPFHVKQPRLRDWRHHARVRRRANGQHLLREVSRARRAMSSVVDREAPAEAHGPRVGMEKGVHRDDMHDE